MFSLLIKTFEVIVAIVIKNFFCNVRHSHDRIQAAIHNQGIKGDAVSRFRLIIDIVKFFLGMAELIAKSLFEREKALVEFFGAVNFLDEIALWLCPGYHDQLRCDQRVVGLDHGVAVDAQFLCQTPFCRELKAGG